MNYVPEKKKDNNGEKKLFLDNLVQPEGSSPVITSEIRSQNPTIVYDDTIDSSFDVSLITKEEPAKENVINPMNPTNIQTHLQYNESVKKKNLLDISNWISESEEDSSFSRQLFTPKPTEKTIPELLKYDVNLLSNSSCGKGRKLFVDSDPISESSSSPFKQPLNRKIISTTNSEMSVKRKELPRHESSSLNNKFQNHNYSQKELNNANRVTRSKEELLSEMIIQVPNILLKNKFGSVMKDVYVNGPQVASTDDDIPLISWKRKVNAEYDIKSDTFIPCPPRQQKEKSLVLYYEAQEFISVLFANSLKSIIERAREIAQLDNSEISYELIVMIEGYDQYLLKIKNDENKKYKTKVLNNLNQSETQSRKKSKISDSVFQASSKEIDYIFNETQLTLGINFFTVKSPQDAVGWLLSFSYTIAFSLYDKFERNQSLANLGTVKSGVDKKSTFIQTMRQFKLMTEPRAEKLYAYYNSLHSIFITYQKQGTLGQDDLKRNIVPPTSDNAMKNLFTSDDPNQLIHD